MGLQSQRDSRKAVCQKIDKQQVYRCERYRQTGQGSIEYGQDTCKVSGKKELDRALDILIYIPSVFYSFYNSCKVIIGKYHGSSVFGHLCSGNTHGNADVCLFQRRSIVDAVTGHGYNISFILPCPYNADLVFR